MIKSIERYLMRQQYAPSLAGLLVNPFYHSRRELRRVVGSMSKQLNGKLLDVGCGRKPYKDLLARCEYIGMEVDTPANRAGKNADIYYDGRIFPFGDAEFDSVICNQVLEHVFSPDEFLREVNRVLKQRGSLLISVPFVWDEHEQPWDYARYSTFGLKSLLERNGFEVLEQEKTNADVRVLFQLINAYLYKVLWTSWKPLNLLTCALLMSPFSIMGVLLYKILPSNPDLYLDQVVLARKVVNE